MSFVEKFIFAESGRDGDVVESMFTRKIPLYVRPMLVRQMLNAVHQWQRYTPLENKTWIAREHNVPSLLVRVDCTIKNPILRSCGNGVMVDGGDVFIYEVDDAPAGQKLTMVVNDQFSELLDLIQQHWPPMRAFVSERRFSDITQWLDPYDESWDGVIWPSMRPQEADKYPHIVHMAAHPVVQEGNKSWMVKTGLAYRVHNSQKLREVLDGPLASSSVVVKPLKGTRSYKIYPLWRREISGRRPSDTIIDVEKLYTAVDNCYGDEWIVQQLVPPIVLPESVADRLDGRYRKYWYTLRMYYGYNTIHGDYIPLGGVCNGTDWRRRVISHGTSSALFLPAKLDNRLYSSARFSLRQLLKRHAARMEEKQGHKARCTS